MDIVDLLIILYLILAAVWGFRRGLVYTVFSLAGLVIGLLIGSWLGAAVPPLLHSLSPTWRSLLAVTLLVVCAIVGNALGAAAGARIRLSAQQFHLSRADSAYGAALGLVVALAVTWYLGLVFSAIPWQPLAVQIRNSAVLQQLYQRVPNGTTWFGDLEQVLSGVPFPAVFANLEPPLPGAVALPAQVGDNAAVEAVAKETVKITSFGCGGLEEGSGFPVASNLILTNAHVVAGGHGTTIQIPGRFGSLPAQVVFFDPSVDLALLRVPNLDLAPVTFTEEDQRGGQGALIGYPEGGPEQVVPGAVRGQLDAQGRDIYNQGLVTRHILVLQASVIPGNSGGPFVNLQGQVEGVVFAKSLVEADEGFALSSAEVLPQIAAAEQSTTTQSTESCVS